MSIMMRWRGRRRCYGSKQDSSSRAARNFPETLILTGRVRIELSPENGMICLTNIENEPRTASFLIQGTTLNIWLNFATPSPGLILPLFAGKKGQIKLWGGDSISIYAISFAKMATSSAHIDAYAGIRLAKIIRTRGSQLEQLGGIVNELESKLVQIQDTELPSNETVAAFRVYCTRTLLLNLCS
jgi:hypothetical protein